MKKKLLGLAAVASTATMIAGAAHAAERGVTDDEILIGTHTALSGPVAVWGVPSVEGMRQRFDAVNAEGGIHGRQIRLVVEDNEYQVPKAVQAGNKLINRDRVFTMLSALGTPMNNAVLPRQLAAGIPNLFPFSSARQMFQPFHKLKFAGGSTYYDQIRAAVKLFAETRGKTKPCTMYQDTDFGREIEFGVKDQTEVLGQSIVAETAHKPTDKDFTAAITKLREASIGSSVKDLASKIDPAAFQEKFGAGIDQLDTLVAAKTVTIARLMEIAPAGTVDPTPSLYNTTMYAMAGLLVIALISNMMVKPVHESHHMEAGEAPAGAKDALTAGRGEPTAAAKA